MKLLKVYNFLDISSIMSSACNEKLIKLILYFLCTFNIIYLYIFNANNSLIYFMITMIIIYENNLTNSH